MLDTQAPHSSTPLCGVALQETPSTTSNTPKTQKWHHLLFVLISLLWTWMWFRPVFWNMTEEQTLLGAFLDIFFLPSVPEYTLGAGIDQLGTFWIFSSLPDILSTNGYLPDIFYPIGWDIGVHTGFAWLDGILTFPLQILGSPAFYNAHVFVTLFSSYLALCYLLWMVLVQKHVLNRSVWQIFFDTLVVGLSANLLMVSPVSMEEIAQGRPTQMFWVFCVTTIMVMFAWCQPPTETTEPPTIETRDWKWMVLLSLSVVCACLVYWFSAVAVGFCVGIVYFVHMLLGYQHPRYQVRKLGLGLLAVLLSLTMVLLLTWRVSFSVLQGEGAIFFSQLSKQPNITLSWFGMDVPIYTQIVVHDTGFVGNLRQIFAQHPTSGIVLILGFLGAIYPMGWRKRLPWIIAWVVALGIPLTGAVVISGHWIPTGQTLLQLVFPPLLRCEYVERMMVVSTVFSGVLFVWCYQDILHRFARYRTVISLSTIVLLGYGQTFPERKDLEVASFVVDDLRMEIASTLPGGMIDMPLSRSENTYVQQLFHKQPLLGGPGLNRVQPSAHKAYCNANSLLRAMEELGRDGKTSIQLDPADITRLRQDGFRTIVLQERNSQTKHIEWEQYIEDQLHISIKPSLTSPRTKEYVYDITLWK